MFKPTTLMGIILLGFLSFVVFQVENKVDSLRGDLKTVNKKILKHKEDIHVLEAEWSYLNRPERLRKMAGKYLMLDDIALSQIQNIDNIPLKSDSYMGMERIEEASLIRK